MSEITKYYFQVSKNTQNTMFNVDCPNGEGTYKINIRFLMITQKWLINITYIPADKTEEEGIKTDWRGLIINPSLNLEYKNIMPYSVGLEGIIPYSPTEENDFNDEYYKFYLLSWDDLEKFFDDE